MGDYLVNEYDELSATRKYAIRQMFMWIEIRKDSQLAYHQSQAWRDEWYEKATEEIAVRRRLARTMELLMRQYN
jgi:hypothetical protein